MKLYTFIIHILEDDMLCKFSIFEKCRNFKIIKFKPQYFT